MATFALVHGAWLGAWCWELVTPLLEQAGHAVVAVDLPCEDASASFDTYADVVCESLTRCDDDVVLVGHSMGAHTVPLVADRRPVRHVVYLCGVVPSLGQSLSDQLLADPGMLDPLWQQGVAMDHEQTRSTWVDADIAKQVMFHDCGDRTASAAFDRLRPQALTPQGSPLPLTRFPAVCSTYVVCRDDKLLCPEWSQRVARDRLDAAIIELPGGHSPFLSRPRSVADLLVGYSGRHCIARGFLSTSCGRCSQAARRSGRP